MVQFRHAQVAAQGQLEDMMGHVQPVLFFLIVGKQLSLYVSQSASEAFTARAGVERT